jgi:signal transduction histidine kinase
LPAAAKVVAGRPGCTSKIEAGKLELNLEPVNLARLIDEVIGTAGQLAEKWPCPLAQARAHDGRRRDGDERTGQGLGFYGAPAERHGDLSRMRRPDHGLHLAEPDVRPQPLINGQCSPNGFGAE